MKRYVTGLAMACAVLGLGLSSAMGNGGGGERAGRGVTSSARAARGDAGPRAGRGGDRGAGGGASANGATALDKPAKEKTTTTRGAGIDKREQNQEKRIEQGIKKGQLTPDEVSSLQSEEKDITTMEQQFKSDGKLSKDEAKQLREALNKASLQIWAQRHDTEGNQKPAVRLGKDIFAKDDLTAKIESGDMTKAEARQFLADFHKLVTDKRRLGADNLTDEQRAKVQAEYNELLNKYFVTK